MCDTCGCGDTHLVPVEIQGKVLAHNDRLAAHNREHFQECGVLAVNLMGSPGSGKTAILEATARAFRGTRKLMALAGDLATDYDARRLQAAGITARSITTGSACHLDAELVHQALHDFPWRDADYLFVENVGNLVCPAAFDLGEAYKVAILSVTEGEDKPLKYPDMFHAAGMMILNKTDLLPHLDFDVEACIANARRVNPDIVVLQVSARSGEGMDAWLAWITEGRRRADTLGNPIGNDFTPIKTADCRECKCDRGVEMRHRDRSQPIHTCRDGCAECHRRRPGRQGAGIPLHDHDRPATGEHHAEHADRFGKTTDQHEITNLTGLRMERIVQTLFRSV